MTASAPSSRRHVAGIGLAIGIGLIVAALWVEVVPWIQGTSLADLSTVCFVGLAAAVLTLGEVLWTRLNPTE